MEEPGVPQAASVTLTWTAATPATTNLRLGLLATRSCGDGCWEGVDVGSPVTGPSPLTLDASGLALEPDQGLAIIVANAPLAPRVPLVYYQVDLEQAFKVEAELTLLG